MLFLNLDISTSIYDSFVETKFRISLFMKNMIIEKLFAIN